MSKHHHRKLDWLLAYCCLLAASTSYASTDKPPVELMVAAAGQSRGLYLYFQASVNSNSKPNPTVSTGQVLVAGKSIPGGMLEYSCVGDTDLTTKFQASPYGKGTEGRVVELNCGSTHQFLFLLLPTGDKATPMRCDSREQILGRPAKATAASFGHQAFCMEDWTDIPNPKERLLDAAQK